MMCMLPRSSLAARQNGLSAVRPPTPSCSAGLRGVGIHSKECIRLPSREYSSEPWANFKILLMMPTLCQSSLRSGRPECAHMERTWLEVSTARTQAPYLPRPGGDQACEMTLLSESSSPTSNVDQGDGSRSGFSSRVKLPASMDAVFQRSVDPTRE